MIVGVVDEDLEQRTAEELLAISLSIGASGLKQINKLQIAGTQLSIFMLGERHCGDEGQPAAAISPVKALHKEGCVGTLLNPERSRGGDSDVGLECESMGYQFPTAHVPRILPARELGHTQRARLVAHRRLRTSSSERGSWGKQLCQPLLILGMLFLIDVLLELEAGRLQLAQRCNRRCGKSRISIDKKTIGGNAKSQRSQPGFIMNTKK